jgi:hypothetical protein
MILQPGVTDPIIYSVSDICLKESEVLQRGGACAGFRVPLVYVTLVNDDNLSLKSLS